MDRLSPQVLMQFARRTVEKELKWKPTADHAPPVPDGAVRAGPEPKCAPLDVRLIQQLGFRAYFNEETKESAWPIPLGLSPDELSILGVEHGILYESPMRGDVFLQQSFRGDQYVHAGLVMTVDGQGCIDDRLVYHDTYTIEGDTDHRGLLKRGYTCKLRRRLSPTKGDRYLRWSELAAPRATQGNTEVA